MLDRRRLLASSGFCVYALLAEARVWPLDPLGGTRRADGTIRAPLLSFAESALHRGDVN